MKLITETTLGVRLLTEEKDGKKNYFIEGVFMQSETKNRNGRVYPGAVMSKEVGRYNKEYVEQNRAMGELGHPEGPTVNLERVSHIIKDLRLEGNDVYGRAKILDTPYGKIVKNLMDEGAKLGVSSRGMGSLKEQDGVNVVQEDFMLASVDVVADPSAPNAFVNGIMEGKEWIWDNGIIKPVQIENYKKIIEKTSSRNLEEQAVRLFTDFIAKL
jgi:Prohead core protein serine protease